MKSLIVSVAVLWTAALLEASAAVKTLTFGGVPVAVQDLSGEVDVFFTAMRFNRAQNVWNVELTVRNRGTRELHGPFALYVESASGTTGLLRPDGMDGQNAYLDLASAIPNAVLGTNQSSLPRTISLGHNGGTPQLDVRVYGHPEPSSFALGLTRSLNEVGQPLPDTIVEEAGPGGPSTNATDTALGLITLGKTTGTHLWKFSKPGYVPVWRSGVLDSNRVSVVANPRLTPLGTNRSVFTPIAGGTLADAGIQINFGPGAFLQNATGIVTRLTGQTLPAFLPLGWSPLQAFAFDLSAMPTAPAAINLTPWSRIAPAETAALIRWNESTLLWDVLGTTSGSTNLQFSISGPGAFVLVVGDTGIFAPPQAQPGQVLSGTPTPFSLPAGLSALGTLTPSLSPASRNPVLVTANAEVTITNGTGALPSGMVLRCDISETYELADGTRRVLPRYESFIVAYQRPGDANPNTTVANFPVRPMLLLGGDELKQGNVRVDVIEPTSFGGGVFDEQGGQVAAGGVRILAAAGVFTNRLAIDLRLLDKTNFVALAGSNIVYAFELSLGQLGEGKGLVAQFDAQATNSFFVLARVLSQDGRLGLDPVERFQSDATGKLISVEPTAGERLPGITSGGQFVLMRLTAPQGLVHGVARNIAGVAVAGLPLRVTSQPWLAFSRTGGTYRLIAPVGNVEVILTDVGTGDTTSGTVLMNDWQTGAVLNITAVAAGPRVTSISPANGSINVALVSPVTITFSEPVNIGTAVGNIILLGVSNAPVNAALNFNLQGNVATLLPTEALEADTIHQVWLGTNIADLAGYKLEGTNAFVFKTQSTAIERGVGAQLVAHEPTNGVVYVHATQGMAEPGQPVILVNEGSGETMTVLAKADGSFEGTLPATVEDFISAVFVNANGTRNTVPLSRQIFVDGSVGLFSGGGAIELPGENGPIEITIEPGAIASKTRFKFEALALTNVLTLISNVQPEDGKVFGGIKASPIVGDVPSQSLDFKYPLRPEQLQGIDPTNATFALCIGRVVNGEQVFEIVDRMHYEGGALVTHSPPFFGFLPGYEVLHDLLILPIMMAQGASRPVAGHVFAAQLDSTRGRPIAGTEEYLPGALVTAKPASSSGRPGHLRAGTVYANTDARGYFSTLVSINAFDPARTVAVTASHPRYSNFEASAALPDIDPTSPLSSVIYPHNVVFPKSAFGQRAAPEISISHSPELPGTNTPVTLTVVATDNDSRPSLQVSLLNVKPLIPGMNVGDADVFSAGDTVREDFGAYGKREVHKFQTARPLRATFSIRATDEDGNDRDLTYQVLFGARPPVSTNEIPASDPNDKTGPQVISSVPSRGSASVAPGDAIIIRFSEPIDRAVLADPAAAIGLSPDAGPPTVELSGDQQLLSIGFGRLKPDTAYTLTLNSQIKDISGNAFDQDPTLDGRNSFSLNFKTAPLRVSQLPGQFTGAGAVIRGNYAFVLERKSIANGELVVFSLENPQVPQVVARHFLPPWPRDLVLIPKYAFKKRADDVEPLTHDLLAVVGGTVGVGTSQFLRVFDIDDPLHMEILAGGAVRNDGMSVVNKVMWSPPVLAYQENGTVDSVSLIDLQTYILVDYLTPEEFKDLPVNGVAGKDFNNDGDYVDAGDTNTPPDELPVPERLPTEFSGKVGAYIASQTFQSIVDFAVAKNGELIGVLLEEGKGMKPDGTRTETNRPPAYRTIHSAGIGLDPEASTFVLTNGSPKRLTFLPDFPLAISNQLSFVDLALVTMRAKISNATNSLVVVNITDRNAPTLLGEVQIPPEFGGSVFTVRLREDGMLLLATEHDLIVLNPSRLHLPASTNGMHPAIVGVIPGAGEGTRTFGDSGAGLYVTSSDGRNVVLQSAPRLQFVYFPTVSPFVPDTLASLSNEQISAQLAQAESTTFLQPARLRTVGDCATSTLHTPSPDSHFYVLVRAPGGAGPTIDLALESLNWAAQPLRPRGLLFPPVHALGEYTLTQLGMEPDTASAPVRPLKAWRVCNDARSELYNVYLSRPFALTYEEITKDELAQLKAQLDREILWSGAQTRVSFDPTMRDNAAVGVFASTVDASDRSFNPGTEALAYSFEGDYVQSPNPGPVAGGMTVATALNVISAHNSELVMDAVDLELPGRRLPLVFRRNYSGQGVFDGPFGRGWDFNFNQRVVEIPEFAMPAGRKLPLACAAVDAEVAQGGDLLFYTGAGRIVAYSLAGTNPPPEIASDPLVQKLGWTNRAAAYYLPPAGVFSPMVKFKDGRYVKLDPDGTQSWYNPAGRLAKIYDRYDLNSLEMIYNRRGDLIRILDDLRRPIDIGYWRLEHDPERRGNIDIITSNPRVAGKIAKLEDYSKRDVLFFYTSDGLLDRREGFDVEVATTTGFRGRQITRYAYSGANEPGRTARSLIGIVGNDPDGTPLMMASQLGNSGRDTVGTFKVANAALQIEQTHPNSAEGLRTGQARTKVSEPGGAVTEYQFDSYGRAKEFIYSGTVGAPLTNKAEYYTNGLVKLVTYPEGNSVEYIYDAANPSLRSRANTVKVLKRPGPRGGPVLEATTQYNPLFNIAEGPKTDFNGNLAIITLTPDKRDAEEIAIGNDKETFEVNEFGQIAHHKTVDGIEHKWEYTDHGFLLRQWTGAFFTRYNYALNSGARSDGTLRGLPSQVIDPNGIATDFYYNERNQIVRQLRDAVEASFTYDQSGNLVESKSAVEPNKYVIERKVYNQVGFLVTNILSEVETDGTTRDLVTTYQPDELNRIKEATYPGGDRHILDYDHAGRIWRYTVEGAYVETYGYDGNGNQTNRTFGTARERFVYDGHDRLKRIVTAVGTTMDFDLDGNGNLLGKTVRDQEGTLLSQVNYSLDEHNRQRTATTKRDDGEVVVRFDFLPVERQTIITDALGVTATTTHDLAGRVISTESPTKSLTFQYDANNNLKQKTVLEGGRSYVEQYNYNARNQLTNIIDNANVPLNWSVGFDGRALVMRDRMGYGVTNRYTILGETKERWNPNGIHTRFTYNANRQVTAIRDGADRGVSSVIDPQGRETESRLPNNAPSTYSSFNALTLPEHAELPRDLDVDSKYDVDGVLTNRVITTPQGVRRESYGYDGLRRPTLLSDPNGSVAMRYDLQGWVKDWTTQYQFLASNPPMAELNFVLSQKVNAGGFRSELNYPANARILTYRRENTGRLLGLDVDGAETVVADTLYAGDDIVGRQVLGNNRLAVENSFNELKRPTARRFTRLSDGSVLVDVRYAYDRNGAQLVRQHVHRGGRTEFFTYDPGYRLVRSDLARPAMANGDTTRALPGFAVPQGVTGEWMPGALARQFSYSADDTFAGTALVNPDNVSTLPLASTWGTPDVMMHVAEVDGFTRQIDEVGNVTRARLAVRLPGNPQPVFVPATLHYNVLGQLDQVVRDDGVVIVNEYTPEGLRMRRQVTGPSSLCVPSDVAFVYDGGNLIEERDLLNSGRVTARYYYGDENDELVAGDLLVGNDLQRHYFLSDVVRSVLAVTDGQGAVVERMAYDTWGQPWITGADNQKPVISRVWRDSNSVFVAFSEPVLPTFGSTGTSNLVVGLNSAAGAFELRIGGNLTPITVTFRESEAGFAFGTVFQLAAATTLTGNAELRLTVNSLQDEANNLNAAATIALDFSGTNPLFTGPAQGSTGAPVLARSTSPFLFQGQVFDYESGLIYCRARFYDPYTAQFLQRDPAGYEAGVNQYAAFAHNPVSMRDPSGAYPVAYEIGESVRQWGSEKAEEWGPAGKFVNVIARGVAWTLSIGTETAEGWEMMNSDNQGTQGLIDRMKGARLIEGDAGKALMVGGTMLVAGNAVAGKLQGFAQGLAAKKHALELERTIGRSGMMSNVKARGRMAKFGVTDIEGEALLYASEKTGLTAHIRYNEAKAAARIEGVLAGKQQKPGFAAPFKSDKTGAVKFRVEATDMRGNVITRDHDYVSDLDMWGFTKNGRLATPAEAARFERVFQKKFAELKKLQGLEHLDTPYQHPSQIELGTSFGGLSGGKKVNQQLMQKIGHPGDVFAIRPAGNGRFFIDQTSEDYVQHMIDMAEPALKQLQIKHGVVPLGFPANWRDRK